MSIKSTWGTNPSYLKKKRKKTRICPKLSKNFFKQLKIKLTLWRKFREINRLGRVVRFWNHSRWASTLSTVSGCFNPKTKSILIWNTLRTTYSGKYSGISNWTQIILAFIKAQPDTFTHFCYSTKKSIPIELKTSRSLDQYYRKFITKLRRQFVFWASITSRETKTTWSQIKSQAKIELWLLRREKRESLTFSSTMLVSLS